MELDELLGSELLECHFGKVWVRLVFSKHSRGQEQQYWVETDNHVSDQPVLRHGTDAEEIMSRISSAVYPSLEQRLSSIERVPNGVRLAFESGSSVFICYDGETIDNLFKLTNRQTGEWSVHQ